jgi:hypothetical protein
MTSGCSMESGDQRVYTDVRAMGASSGGADLSSGWPLPATITHSMQREALINSGEADYQGAIILK